MILKLRMVCAVTVLLCVVQAAGAQQALNLASVKAEAGGDIENMHVLTQQMVDEIFSYSELGFQEFETSRYATPPIFPTCPDTVGPTVYQWPRPLLTTVQQQEPRFRP